MPAFNHGAETRAGPEGAVVLKTLEPGIDLAGRPVRRPSPRGGQAARPGRCRFRQDAR